MSILYPQCFHKGFTERSLAALRLFYFLWGSPDRLPHLANNAPCPSNKRVIMCSEIGRNTRQNEIFVLIINAAIFLDKTVPVLEVSSGVGQYPGNPTLTYYYCRNQNRYARIVRLKDSRKSIFKYSKRYSVECNNQTNIEQQT